MAARTTKGKSPSARRRSTVKKPAAPRRVADRKQLAVRSSAPERDLGRDLPASSNDWQAAVDALHSVTESLQAVQASFSDALFHMPRASEYEPLVEPLRQFACLVTPLSEHLAAWPRIMAQLQERPRPAPAVLPPPAPASGLSAQAVKTLHEVARELEDLRGQLMDALGTLPSADEYAPVARQLRELASVSPSLLEWMREVPRLSAPLANSVEGLRQAAVRIEQLETKVRRAAGLLAGGD